MEAGYDYLLINRRTRTFRRLLPLGGVVVVLGLIGVLVWGLLTFVFDGAAGEPDTGVASVQATPEPAQTPVPVTQTSTPAPTVVPIAPVQPAVPTPPPTPYRYCLPTLPVRECFSRSIGEGSRLGRPVRREGPHNAHRRGPVGRCDSCGGRKFARTDQTHHPQH